MKNISKQGRFIPHVNEGDFSPAMLKRFNTSVRYKEEKSLPWYAYVRDRLTRCDFGSNFETEEQARQWVEWTKETCEKGRKTPEGWVLN
ncbi:MAG: hypothetical protein J6X18_07445 [Bacteroidales bacterium]|nr:hypothetical protein [Bacteroidales bacterium]